MLIEHEEHNEQLSQELAAMILAQGEWTHPVAVDACDLIIMDGHHRVRAAKLMGLSRIPSILFKYDSANVRLLSWRKDFNVTVEGIRAAASSGRPLPEHTSRHVFSPEVGRVSVPLAVLRRAAGASGATEFNDVLG